MLMGTTMHLTCLATCNCIINAFVKQVGSVGCYLENMKVVICSYFPKVHILQCIMGDRLNQAKFV